MDPTSRKLHNFREFGGNMYVSSIVDSDRAEHRRLESLNKSVNAAVGRREAITDDTVEKPNPQSLLVKFGRLSVEDNLSVFQFYFEPPRTCTPWPGPKSGFQSFHAVISKHNKPPSSRKKKCFRHEDPKVRVSLRKKRTTTNQLQQAEAAPLDRRSVASRSPPLHLLTLPPEIRNAIWSLLAVHPGPVEAQLRSILPCPKLSRLRDRVIRPFPQVPEVAAVNRQLRREVLTIFYGSNHFTFEKDARSMFKQHNMTDPGTMQQWSPQAEIADFMTRVDIRFMALPQPSYDEYAIIYHVRKQRDQKVKVTVSHDDGSKKSHAEKQQFCLCEEQSVIDGFKIDYAAMSPSMMGNALDVGIEMVVRRLAVLFSRADLKRSWRFRVDDGCIVCNKPTFKIIYSGA